ncbi:efflux RND transporter permease subunit [Agarilytica rhodophyticola]|uniref:efflux RND transporter permease subunit n=1 Tax=Agarilytica rhodophyticola TaxID=1737490 RepID=UPI000B34510C|nr:efflux RND transporter permease subunit [Agarilytica rhodophyticola]
MSNDKLLPNTQMYHNRYLLVLSIIIILVAGLSAFANLPRLEDPRITNRNPTVLTFFPGASSARVESLITKPIEDELRELHEIKTIESTSRDGASLISIELQDWVDETNNEQIFSKIRAELEDAASSFPAASGEPEFDDKRGASAFTLVVELSIPKAAKSQLNILTRLSQELADRLRNISNTELVKLYGAPQEEITVEVMADQVSALGLNNQQIANLIQKADAKKTAGAFRSSKRDVLIEVAGELSTVDRIAAIPIENVYLGDIAEIKKTIMQPETDIAFSKDGYRSIYVAARMTNNVRVDVWTARANEVLGIFKKEFGSSVSIETIFEQNQYTEDRLNSLSTNLILGVLVVMLVVLFSMGWRPALIVGLALPLSMAGALFSLSFFGEQIHQMTIFGMIIAIGLLIDNAIVVTDEVRKNIRQRNMNAAEALSNAVSHLKIPLLASTLTTILGFMPIFLLPGNIGDFVSPIAISVVMALALSFCISLTIIATLAAIFTKKNDDTASGSVSKAWWQNGIENKTLAKKYRSYLHYALLHPKRSVLVAMLLPIAGIFVFTQLPTEFFPSADRDQFEIQVWLSEDASIKRTYNLADEMNKHIVEQDGVEKTMWLVGGSVPSVYYNQIMNKDNYPSYAHAVVFAESASSASRLIDSLQDSLDENFPQARVIVRAFAQGPSVSSPVSFRVVGPHVETLRSIGESIRLVLQNQTGVTHAFASTEGGKPKFWLNADEDKVKLAGLTLDDVSSQFQTQLDGVIGGTVLEDLQELPVRVKASDTIRGDLMRIASMKINAPAIDTWLPVSALGDITLKPEVTSITRRNGERVNTISAFLEPNIAPIDITNNVLNVLKESDFSLPSGYRIEVAGDADAQNQAVGQLLTYAPVLLVLMMATLILAFKSVTLALVIIVVALLSSGLGFLSLGIFGLPVGFNPLIGTAGLIGVAINGSIVVLAAIKSNSMARAGNVEAIIEETMGTSRHILSTTFTTVAGFGPLLMSGGTFWPPLAVVIAGGVGLSIILSLLFTPAVYCMLHPQKPRLSPVVQEAFI